MLSSSRQPPKAVVCRWAIPSTRQAAPRGRWGWADSNGSQRPAVAPLSLDQLCIVMGRLSQPPCCVSQGPSLTRLSQFSWFLLSQRRASAIIQEPSRADKPHRLQGHPGPAEGNITHGETVCPSSHPAQSVGWKESVGSNQQFLHV